MFGKSNLQNSKNIIMEYSFLSQNKFNQIVEEHVKTLSKSSKNIITEEIAQQVIRLIENNFEDVNVDRNTTRWREISWSEMSTEENIYTRK